MTPTQCLRASFLALGLMGVVGCHLSDALKVPVPTGVSSQQGLANQTGAEAVYAGAKSNLFTAVDGGYGLVQWNEQLTDEVTWSAFSQTYEAADANVDARRTAAYSTFQESGDYPWEYMLQARSQVLFAVPGLLAYEPAAGQSKVGEAYALAAYAEMLVAESFCGGTPLSEVLPGGGYQYGVPLTDDSLLKVAEAHFDSALAHTAQNDTVTYLADVGFARLLLDRGQYDSAASLVQNVPASFVYNALFASSYSSGYYNLSLYGGNTQYPNSATFNVADRKGENGLNFLTANDPRLTFNTSNTTFDGGTWYLPTKFNVNLSNVPMATGIEAALIQAEVALQDGNPATWLSDLNALRFSSCSVSGTDTTCTLGTGQVAGQTAGLPPLTDPGTDTGRVSLMFRERAFWLYGTGERLGDLRRLMRPPYSRDSSLVFPRGPYPNGSNSNLPSPISTYGTDVNLTLPTATVIANHNFTETNPNYKGCITSTTTP